MLLILSKFVANCVENC